MAKIDDKTLEQLKAQHGDVLVLTSPDGAQQIACKRPSRALYRKLKSELADERRRTSAADNFVLGCAVHPSKDDLDRLLDENAALADSFCERLLDAIGAGTSDSKKV